MRRRQLLFRAAVSILDDLSYAEDAVQDALLAGWLAAGSLSDPDRLAAWLVTIVRNRCRNMLKDRARRRRIGRRMFEDGEPVPDPLDVSAASPVGVEFREELATLPRSQRAAVSGVLAGSADLRAPRVRTALSRAAARLRARFA